MHHPPGGLRDFDGGKSPTDLYSKWDRWIADAVAARADEPAWYDSAHPPAGGKPAEKAPPWQGIPRMALLLNSQDLVKAATAVDAPVEYGSGRDALLIDQPPFLDARKQKVAGLHYRPQDEYLEWVTRRDPDGVVSEIWFTCEAPEYWDFIARNDQDLLVAMYASVTGLPEGQIDLKELYFQEELTHVEPFSQNNDVTYSKGDYNPYNRYNTEYAVHLTQGANSLGAEISLARSGSLIWGDPAETQDPRLICCSGYGEPNRFSDPTIGKEVNDLARAGSYVTLRDPIGLYIQSIAPDNFTIDGTHGITNFDDYFVKVRKSDDGTMILRAVFKVPDGVRDAAGKQLRVGDLHYLADKITMGGQVADAITMHLFAQALPGAPAQDQQPCMAHPCNSTIYPGVIVPTPIGRPCKGAPHDFAFTLDTSETEKSDALFKHLSEAAIGLGPTVPKAKAVYSRAPAWR